MVQPVSTGAQQDGRGHLTSAAGGRRPSVTRGSLVSGGSCLPTTELPSMSKGKALPSPDAAREQAAPQRSHRGRIEHQAVLQAIAPLVFNKPFLERRIWDSWWAPPEVQRWLVFYLLWRYLDPGTQGTTLLLFLKVESESQRGPSATRLSLPPTLSLCLSSPALLRLGLWDLQAPGEHQKAAERDWQEPGERAWPPPLPGGWDRGRRSSGFLPTLILTTPFPPSPSRPSHSKLAFRP